ncbi:unnamed protein product [Rhodiola kirilowii]
MLSSMTKRNQKAKGRNRILISVNVVGSAGPIRFVVNEDDVVADVVSNALKIYRREGRLPVLGSNFADFMLFCPAAGSDFLDPLERIGFSGTRNFLLCKKPQLKGGGADDYEKDAMRTRNGGKGSGALKSWINKSLNVVISAR